MKVFDGIDELVASAGAELGSSDWVEVDQDRIDGFAEATGDHQWIHVDPVKASSGLYGATIAHGYLTLSLLPVFIGQVYRVENIRMAVNYGLNKVRFPSPVPVGSKLRATCTLKSVQRLEGAVQATTQTVIAIDGVDKPACVAESIVRYVA